MKPRFLRMTTTGNLPRMRGMTTVGMIILVIFVGMFAYAGLQLTPIYLNYMKIAGVVDGIKEEFDGQSPTVGNMRRSIDRRFSIENVSVITSKDIKITPEQGGFLVDASYDHTTHYLGNVSFSVHFDKKAVVRR
ncbi:MAG: DUF4845 domain-containing protein [Woeseia sp.]